jgi:hypothetical protein
MVPSGEPTEKTVQALLAKMQAGDTIIDGGNSYFKDDVRRSKLCAAKGIQYVDVGTSGGVWGLERGYCMMIGGPKEAVQRLDPIFKTLAPGRGDIPRTPGREKLAGSAAGTSEDGYIHCGPSGAGHFVKMVHNGIEYGMMQAYAEGFDIFKNADQQRSSRRYPLRSQPARHRRGLAARQRGQFLAARSDRDGAGRESDALGVQRLRAGFRRRPLDDPGGARRGRSRRSADGGALRALPFAPGAHVRGEDALRHAQKFGGHIAGKK